MTEPRDEKPGTALDRWLVEMVRRVDPEVADTMLAPEFTRRLVAETIIQGPGGCLAIGINWDAESLFSAFAWDDTEEGFDFWDALDELLREEFGDEYPRATRRVRDEGRG